MTELQPWQQRVVDEKKELDVKRKALMSFLCSPKPPGVQDIALVYMRQQLNAMDNYSYFLERRTSLFKEPT